MSNFNSSTENEQFINNFSTLLNKLSHVLQTDEDRLKEKQIQESIQCFFENNSNKNNGNLEQHFLRKIDDIHHDLFYPLVQFVHHEYFPLSPFYITELIIGDLISGRLKRFIERQVYLDKERQGFGTGDVSSFVINKVIEFLKTGKNQEIQEKEFVYYEKIKILAEKHQYDEDRTQYVYYFTKLERLRDWKDSNDLTYWSMVGTKYPDLRSLFIKLYQYDILTNQIIDD